MIQASEQTTQEDGREAADNHPEEAGLLHNIASVAFRRDLPFESKIAQFLSMAREQLNADVGLLTRVEGGICTVEHAVSSTTMTSPGLQGDVHDTLCHEALRQNGTLALENVGASQYSSHPAYMKHKTESYIGAIIRVNGDKYGTVCFTSTTPRSSPFTVFEREYVQMVALWAGSEIERRDLERSLERATTVIRREHRIATTLQEALLPPLPAEIPGMEFGYAYRAALDESNVGGDFYGAYPLDARRYALVIGDVSGKGLNAASQVAALQNMLRFAISSTRTLSDAINQVNTVMMEHNLLAGFATLFVATYDLERLTLTYCSCGHEPPMIVANGVVETLQTTGPPIGVALGIKYEEKKVRLAPGDVLMMYTDGLSEAGLDRRTLLGTEGLAEILQRRASNGAASAIASDIVADVAAFSNGRLLDDACLIIAKVTETVNSAKDVRSSNTSPNVFLAQSATKYSSPVTLSERLRETPIEEQFRLLVDSVAEYAIFLLDTHGYVMTWNRGAERLKGYSALEIVGRHFSVFYTPNDVQRGHPLDELAIAASDGRYEEEGWRVRKDGTRFWANVVITALRDRDGILCGYGKVTRDFTDRRRAEQQMRRSEERFRLLVQGVKDYAIFMLDPTGHVASWNEGAQRIKGYSADEVLGQHFSMFYTQSDIDRGHPAYELAMAANMGRYEEENWRVRKDGTRFWANVVITPLKDASDNLYGFAKVTRDFTERKDADESRMQTMRDQVSRTFLREILYSVTEGRLRFCEDDSELPETLPCDVEERTLSRYTLVELRKGLKRLTVENGFTRDRSLDLITAAAEAAMNAVVHATAATYAICSDGSTIQVWIKDHGTGIELNKLHRVTLERGFTTENSLGHGFWLILQMCDRLWLRSTSSGTTVVVEQDFHAPDPEWLSRPRKHEQYFDATPAK